MASVRRVTESRCVAATLGDHRSSQYGGRVPAINADGGPLHLNDCSGAFLRAEHGGPVVCAHTPSAQTNRTRGRGYNGVNIIGLISIYRLDIVRGRLPPYVPRRDAGGPPGNRRRDASDRRVRDGVLEGRFRSTP